MNYWSSKAGFSFHLKWVLYEELTRRGKMEGQVTEISCFLTMKASYHDSFSIAYNMVLIMGLSRVILQLIVSIIKWYVYN